MSQYTASEVFQSFEQLKVLIIGDIMIDSYLWGNVDRISPEAPVPIVQVKKREKRLGGAANVALNIKSMGATPIICSVVGDDNEGQELIDIIQEQQMDISGIVQSKNRLTTIKHRIISGDQHILRVDTEHTTPLESSEETTLIQAINSLINTIDVIIFEDYDKGSITPSLIQEVKKIARKSNIPIVVDPKKRNFLAYEGITLFKPNLKEMIEGLKLDIDKENFDSILSGIQKLKERLKNEKTLVTLSEKGMVLDYGSSYHHEEAHLRKIADVSGAGDTVISIAALALAVGLNDEKIVKLANLAGGLVCEHVGVVPIDKALLLAEAEEKKVL